MLQTYYNYNDMGTKPVLVHSGFYKNIIINSAYLMSMRKVKIKIWISVVIYFPTIQSGTSSHSSFAILLPRDSVSKYTSR